jgi:hypothetical protein
MTSGHMEGAAPLVPRCSSDPSEVSHPAGPASKARALKLLQLLRVTERQILSPPSNIRDSVGGVPDVWGLLHLDVQYESGETFAPKKLVVEKLAKWEQSVERLEVSIRVFDTLETVPSGRSLSTTVVHTHKEFATVGV